MSRKTLLSCTAVAAIVLFGTHLNVQAEILKADKGEVKTATTGETYQYLQAVNGGKIIGKNLTLTGGHPINAQDLDAVDARTKSSIELWDTTIKSANDTEMNTGLNISHESIIKMNGGSITARVGAVIDTDGSGESTLENVKISGDKDNPAIKGVSVQSGTVNLNNVTVSKANYAVHAQSNAQVKVSGGSFGGRIDSTGGTVTLSNNVTVTSDDYGLHADGEKSQITMTGGEVAGKKAALFAEKGGHITVTDVVLKTNKSEFGALSMGSNSTIELYDTIIQNSSVGIKAKNDNATIKMIGGSIEASIGVALHNTKSNENKLENVKISNGLDNTLMEKGVSVDEKSKITLKDVTVTNATRGISLGNSSQVIISGGSFSGKTHGIQAQSASTVTLNDNTTVISSDGNALHANDLGSQITMTSGTVQGKQAALFAEKGHIDVTDVALKTDGNGIGAQSLGTNSIINLQNTTIKEVKIGLKAQEGGAISMTGGSIDASDRAVYITGKNSIVHLNNVAISSLSDTSTQKPGNGTRHIPYGISIPNGAIHIEDNGTIDMTGGSIKSSTQTAVTVNNSHDNKLKNVHIHAKNRGIISYGSTLTLEDVTVESTSTAMTVDYKSQVTISGSSFKGGTMGVSVAYQSTAFLKDVQIDAKNGLLVGSSSIVMTGGKVTGNVAFIMANGNGKIDATDVTTKTESQAIALSCPNEREICNHTLNLTKTKLSVEDGIGIFASLAANSNVNLNNSEIHADVLLTERMDNAEIKDQSMLTLTADHSLLEGRAGIEKDAKTLLDLKNDTTWIVKTSTKEKDKDGNLLDIAQRTRSDVSTLNLDDSSIVFQEPIEEHYHTLHIGSGKPENTAVYNATGNAKIYFNTAWSDGAASADQKTDRLLIHGDVSGTTAVYIQSDLGDRNSVINAADPSSRGGLSLIQVSGKAQEDSFKLANGYITLGGLPYKYTLTAYGPESSHGKADIEQNLFDEKNENFWDFRLHKETLDSGTGSGGSIGAPVAQTANYLVMPNALFYSGLTDMAKQNALLANIRTSVLGKEEEKNTGFFLSTYGSTGTLSSARGPLKYGYGADMRYAALQAGATLAAIERQNITTYFGVVGTYGQLSFTPKDMADVSKSTLDKWSLTAYGSLQHNNGFYLDTLFSYGVLKGDIGNAIIGKTAKVKNAKLLSLSTTLGKQFATGMEGLTFEPQAQLAYQHLMFKPIEDANNLIIDMNTPSQWLIRVGGRLTKNIATENNHPLSFYGKVNFIKTFGDDGNIKIGDKFDLDPMGAAIEGGVGINAQLLHNLSLHGDVSYQQKLQKTGLSGASFSGGIRYQF
ncbi:autotransporter outer membrane beta-barrel domain-containing protein [Bartonella harrusi]|uniref:Autotransporter outer membrane beta-barrel domain-containing protein n=1 Tax=Bartonella harrusi TaxID=2961895 RepID=A0ABY5EYQ6_9HYPH|nr:autotransporter outer membrane beta-barrel domain-containing protein [Bartonella harrusi]